MKEYKWVVTLTHRQHKPLRFKTKAPNLQAVMSHIKHNYLGYNIKAVMRKPQ